MRKKGNTVLAGLIICLLLVFLAAAGKLFGAYLKYQKGDVSYEKLQEYVQEPEEEESPESEKEKEEPKNRYLEIDFAGLKAVNPDVIAWIQIPALDISIRWYRGKIMHIIFITFFRENPISTGASLWTAIISRTLRIRIRSCTGII